MLSRDAYLNQMKNCRQFDHFGIVPEWRPGEGDVDGFIHDEVVRQFHDPRVRDDGGVRVQWMRAAWDYARGTTSRSGYQVPTVEQIEALGRLVEPQVNYGGFRKVDVYIGDGKGAPPHLIPRLVTFLSTAAFQVQMRTGRTGVHPAQYRALWNYEILTDTDVVTNFVEMLKFVDTADDWYLAYEAIHPFGDGNGRTGKILHNWFLHTLDEPVLVADYFGGGNP